MCQNMSQVYFHPTMSKADTTEENGKNRKRGISQRVCVGSQRKETHLAKKNLNKTFFVKVEPAVRRVKIDVLNCITQFLFVAKCNRSHTSRYFSETDDRLVMKNTFSIPVFTFGDISSVESRTKQ